MATIFDFLKGKNVIFFKVNIIKIVIFEVHHFDFIVTLWAIKLYIYSNIVISQFMIRFKKVTSEMGIKNLNTMTKSVYFTKFKVLVKFLRKLAVKIFELIFCSVDAKIKVSIMCDHFPITICAK